MAERSTRGIPKYTGRKKPTAVGVGTRSLPKKPGQKQPPPNLKR